MKLFIYEYLKEYAKKKPIRLHMPSHKGRGAFDKLFPVSELDLTEIDEEGLLRAVNFAEKDVGRILGAKYVKIFSTGASVAMLSAVYAVRRSGKKMIINRSAHKSVYNALALSEIEPVIAAGKVKDGLCQLPTREETAKLLDENPEAIGVLYTYPDYFGRTFDIKAIKQETEKRGKLLIIDGAHGGHYAFIKGATYAGEFADIWIDSLHKTASALNQGALLLDKNGTFAERLKEAAEVFNTTSPCYPIFASCEYGVKESLEKQKEFVKLNERVNRLKDGLSESSAVFIDCVDPYKITIDLKKSGLERESVLKELKKRKIFYELFDGRYMLFMPSVKTSGRELKKLHDAIKNACRTRCDEGEETSDEKREFAERAMPYLAALSCESERTELKNAAGKIAAENAGVFPPCNPIVTAGERISDGILEKLIEAEARGAAFGVNDGRIKTVKE